MKRTTAFLLWSLLFGIIYTQPRLYYSNQNQYFLHGLARGGLGFLRHDWLANTADPTPLFSTLVAFTARYLSDSLFYIYFILLLGAYLHALVGIFEHLSGDRATSRTRLAFVAVLVALHSALLRWTSAQMFGVDYPWYFQAGVANQYILGAGLQPSVFGVLLVLSVRTFLRGRPMGAATWSSLAAVMHSTFLLAAAFLTLAYLSLLLRERRIRTAALVGSWSLLLVTPVLIYNLRTFGPSSREAFAEAQYLLAHFRIPHHAEVERWLDGIAWAQIGWIALALCLVRDGRLFVIVFVPFVLAFTLTLAQLVSGSDTLALLFPWRVSSILMPLATAIMLTRFVQHVSARLAAAGLQGERLPQAASVGVLVIVTVGGAFITYFDLGYRTDRGELDLLDYIRTHKTEGDVYLLPVEVPPLKAGKKGAASGNFTPPPRRNAKHQNISVDLQRFRLYTGAPLFVDFKSIPYRDVEVLQWNERVRWSQQLYEHRDWNQERIKDELRRQGITHVVAVAGRDVRCEELRLVYADTHYRLYRLQAR